MQNSCLLQILKGSLIKRTVEELVKGNMRRLGTVEDSKVCAKIYLRLSKIELRV